MIKEIPAVSVIIPMYNAEKYIGECLESILVQTLKNFEIIIVDDCSADKGVEIAETYIPKFDKRLQIIKLKTNTGGPAVPRNKGLEMSRGEYIFFMDNDDVLTKTALEEMYDLAEKFQADVIYCEKYFMSEGTGKDFKKNVHVANKLIQLKEFVNKPTFITEDLTARIMEVLDYKIAAPPWLKFIKRDVLVENDIKFFNIVQEDNDWTLRLVFFAKKIMRVPNKCYIRRMRKDSAAVWQSTQSLNEYIHKRIDRTIRGFKLINNFMEKLEFFKKRPELKYTVLNSYALADFQNIVGILPNFPPSVIYEVINTEFKEYLGDFDTLVSYLVTNNLFLMHHLMVILKKLN